MFYWPSLINSWASIVLDAGAPGVQSTMNKVTVLHLLYALALLGCALGLD